MEAGQPTVIANQEGARTTPSVVAFTKSGERLVGQVAKRQSITNPENTVFSIKRFMGRRSDEVSEEMKMVPYKVTARGQRRCARGHQRQEVFAARNLGHDPHQVEGAAESYLGEKVTQAVITGPGLLQRRAAAGHQGRGKIAGLEVMRIINEPTAAALAYGLDKKKNETIAVYDSAAARSTSRFWKWAREWWR